MSFIYNLIAILLIGSTIYQVVNDTPTNKNWFKTIIVMMMFTAGLAYAISPDWLAYWNAFEGAAQTDFSDMEYIIIMFDMEPGYIYLNKIVSTVGLGYASFTLLIAIIALTLKGKMFYKYSPYAFMTLMMYFIPTYLFEEHVHVRQGLANAIMLCSIPYIIERKLFKFLLVFALAFMFHKAVVLFIFAYWIVKIKFNNTLIIVLVSVAIISNLVGLNMIIDSIAQFLPFGVAETYNDYASELSSEGGVLGDIVKIITVAIILIFNKQVSEKDELFSYFRNIYIFGVITYFFFGGGIFAARLPGFFTVYIIFVIPRMVYALRENTSVKNFLFIGFTVYSILLYGNFYRNWGDRSGFGNYNSVLSENARYGFLYEE
ncbi:EpsG family protein [Moheibacter stercoris]|uniref:EpsG family protein n=1 Tax=Moheibacter stercoris TaxID=1628251 RepID=A0ABV2LTC5_9FLAO